MNEALIQLAIQETPAVIAGIKSLFARDNPNEPQPTNEEVIAAFNAAFASSLAKDENWLALHPEPVPPTL
jgi:hypothetical protein